MLTTVVKRKSTCVHLWQSSWCLSLPRPTLADWPGQHWPHLFWLCQQVDRQLQVQQGLDLLLPYSEDFSSFMFYKGGSFSTTIASNIRKGCFCVCCAGAYPLLHELLMTWMLEHAACSNIHVINNSWPDRMWMYLLTALLWQQTKAIHLYGSKHTETSLLSSNNLVHLSMQLSQHVIHCGLTLSTEQLIKNSQRWPKSLSL